MYTPLPTPCKSPTPLCYQAADVFYTPLGFPGSSEDKESSRNTGDTGLIPGSGNPLEKGMATMDKGSRQGYSPQGLKRVRHN